MTDLRDNAKGSIIAMEEVSLGTTYSLTIAPCDDYQYWNANDRMDKFRSWLRLRLRKLSADIEAHLELSPRGRLHMHGTIRFTSRRGVYNFYLNDIYSLLKTSQVEIDTIKDPKIWYDYCNKQKKCFPITNVVDLNLSTKQTVEESIYVPMSNYCVSAECTYSEGE